LGRFHVIARVLGYATYTGVVGDLALSIDAKVYSGARLSASKGQLMEIKGVLINRSSIDTECKGTAAGGTLSIPPEEASGPGRGIKSKSQD
jgi:hypothetical protein